MPAFQVRDFMTHVQGVPIGGNWRIGRVSDCYTLIVINCMERTICITTLGCMPSLWCGAMCLVYATLLVWDSKRLVPFLRGAFSCQHWWFSITFEERGFCHCFTPFVNWTRWENAFQFKMPTTPPMRGKDAGARMQAAANVISYLRWWGKIYRFLRCRALECCEVLLTL